MAPWPISMRPAHSAHLRLGQIGLIPNTTIPEVVLALYHQVKEMYSRRQGKDRHREHMFMQGTPGRNAPVVRPPTMVPKRCATEGMGLLYVPSSATLA